MQEIITESIELCIGHRRKHGLICNDVDNIICHVECKIESTCPMKWNVDSNIQLINRYIKLYTFSGNIVVI